MPHGLRGAHRCKGMSLAPPSCADAARRQGPGWSVHGWGCSTKQGLVMQAAANSTSDCHYWDIQALFVCVVAWQQVAWQQHQAKVLQPQPKHAVFLVAASSSLPLLPS
jgi:hypothetical protein